MPHVKKDSFKTGNSTEMLGFGSRSLIIVIAFGIVLLAAIGVAGYFFLQYQQTQAQLSQSAKANNQAELISEVGKLIVLPSGEQPTIATVSDVNRLKEQQFFAHAKNGDKVLIYSKAQEAILYDPFSNKIVEVGPITLTQVSPTASGPMPTAAPIKVALYNGTNTVGLTTTIANQLEKKMANITVISRDTAQNASYGQTIIVDLTGKNASQASALAKTLNGKVGKLPVGEVAPKNADVLVILGK
jgi:hypothetical protein